MNPRLSKSLLSLGLITAMGIPAISSAAPRMADISVSIQRPQQNPFVNSLAGYKVRASNIGRRAASSVVLVVNLPVTNTSPTKYLLGQISELDSRCNIQVGKITCGLGNIADGGYSEISFKYAAPVSMNALMINAAATTSSQELSVTNNSAASSPSQYLQYYSMQIVGPVIAHNSHCTGTSLSSYFECQLFPSSLSSHDVQFNADGTLSIPGYPSFSGYWQQNSNQQLSFQYLDDGIQVASFNGLGSANRCFDGITQFPNSNYVSPYRVCL